MPPTYEQLASDPSYKQVKVDGMTRFVKYGKYVSVASPSKTDPSGVTHREPIPYKQHEVTFEGGQFKKELGWSAVQAAGNWQKIVQTTKLYYSPEKGIHGRTQQFGLSEAVRDESGKIISGGKVVRESTDIYTKDTIKSQQYVDIGKKRREEAVVATEYKKQTAERRGLPPPTTREEFAGKWFGDQGREVTTTPSQVVVEKGARKEYWNWFEKEAEVPKSATYQYDKPFLESVERRRQQTVPKRLTEDLLVKQGKKVSYTPQGLMVVEGDRKEYVRDLKTIEADIPKSATYQQMKSYDERKPRDFFSFNLPSIRKTGKDYELYSKQYFPLSFLKKGYKKTEKKLSKFTKEKMPKFTDVSAKHDILGKLKKQAIPAEVIFPEDKKKGKRDLFTSVQFTGGYEKESMKQDLSKLQYGGEGVFIERKPSEQETTFKPFKSELQILPTEKITKKKKTVEERRKKYIEREEKKAEFIYGTIKGGYEGTRTKPLKAGVFAGIGYAATAYVAPKISGTTAKWIWKAAPTDYRIVTKSKIALRSLGGVAVKYGLPSAYVGVKGYQISQEKSYIKKGEIVGSAVTTEVLPSYAGGLAGIRWGYKPVQRFALEQEVMLTATKSRAAFKLSKDATTAASIVEQYKIPDEMLRPIEMPKSYTYKQKISASKFVSQRSRSLMGSVSQKSDMGYADWFEPGSIKYSTTTQLFSGKTRILKDIDIAPGKFESSDILSARFSRDVKQMADVHEYAELKMFPAHRGFQTVPVKGGGETKKIMMGEQLYRKYLGMFTIRKGATTGKDEFYRMGKDLPDFIWGGKRVVDVGKPISIFKRSTSDKKVLSTALKEMQKFRVPKEDYAVGKSIFKVFGKQPKAEVSMSKWVTDVKGGMGSYDTKIMSSLFVVPSGKPSKSLRRVSKSVSKSFSKSVSPSFSKSISTSKSPSISKSISISPSSSLSKSFSSSTSSSFSSSISPSISPSPSPSTYPSLSPSPSPSKSPSIYPSPSPPPKKPPPFFKPDLDFGLGKPKKKKVKKKTKQKATYKPSLYGIDIFKKFGVTGKAPKFVGIGVRPVTKQIAARSKQRFRF